MLEKYRCGQCNGYLWLCDEDLVKDMALRTTKRLCKRTQKQSQEYSRMQNSNNSKPNPADGLLIISQFVSKDNLRTLSYADYQLLQLKKELAKF